MSTLVDEREAAGHNAEVHRLNGNTDEKGKGPASPDLGEKRPVYSGAGPKRGTRPKPVICRLCGGEGHTKRHCPLADGRAPEDGASTSTAVRVAAVEEDEAITRGLVLHEYYPMFKRADLIKLVRAGHYVALKDGGLSPEAVADAFGLELPAKEEPVPALGVFQGVEVPEAAMRDKEWLLFATCRAAIIVMGVLLGILVIMGAWRVPARIFLKAENLPQLPFRMSVHAGLGWTLWLDWLMLAAYYLLAGHIAAVALFYLFKRKNDFRVETMVAYMDADRRLCTSMHVDKHKDGVRLHRYRWFEYSWHWPFRVVKDLYVVDHWASIALSEYGFSGDVDMFLKNVHLKFLRAAVLGVEDRWYVCFKEGTTEFLRLYLRGDFPHAVPGGWAPDGH